MGSKRRRSPCRLHRYNVAGSVDIQGTRLQARGTTNPHKGSFDVLLGKDATRDELSKLSIENRVTPKTPPIFLWCTANDDCVPAQNSLVMAKACVSNKVPVELHMFDCGPHGLSTCDKVTGWNEAFYLDNCKQWIKMSVDFLAKYLGV